MYTTHGHQIPGTEVSGLQPLRHRCGGFERCAQCLREAAKVLVKSEKDHHHILIGLSLKTAGTDQKIRGLLANAICWTFFGIEGEQVVHISDEETAKCKIAAERCMVALREMGKIPDPEQEAFLAPQVKELARFISEEVPGEPSESGGAIETAIRIIRSLLPDEREDGNWVTHTRRELELIGEEPEVIEWYVKVIRAYASFGHSGGSVSATLPVLYDLIRFKNLSPITNNPDEWYRHEQPTAGDFWQNKRNSALFSDDGGKTYYDVNEQKKLIASAYYNKESDESSVSGGIERESASDEQEPENAVESSVRDASEAPKEGLHGI